MHEYGTLKPVEAILRRGRRKRENTGEDKPTMVHCIHIWKHHNETPYSTIICLKIIQQKLIR
jgi:hypothetical protein